MTYREAYKSTKQWQRKASLISVFHYKRQLLGNHWTMRDTAQYFDVSLGKVCEDIKITLNIEKVKNCDSRKDALIILR